MTTIVVLFASTGMLALNGSSSAHAASGPSEPIIVASAGAISELLPDGSGQEVLFPANGSWKGEPSSSPNGDSIAFSMQTSTGEKIFQAPPVPGAAPQLVSAQSDTGNDFWPAWGPGGAQIAYIHEPSGVSSGSLYMANRDGSDPHAVCPSPDTSVVNPNYSVAWSPDGKWIAYDHHVSTINTIYLVDPVTCEVRQLTTGNDDGPAWSLDSQTVYFNHGESSPGATTAIWQIGVDGSGESDANPNGGNCVFPSISDDGFMLFNNLSLTTLSYENIATKEVQTLPGTWSGVYGAWLHTTATSPQPSPSPSASPTPTPTPTASKLNWVALGDSYSSGEGNPPFLAGSNIAGDKCHRSLAAYSEVIVKSQPSKYSLSFHACSGAVTADLYAPNESNVKETTPQLNWLSSTTSIVTVTIGGNDVGFPDVMSYCATRNSLEPTCQQKFQAGVDAEISLLGAINDEGDRTYRNIIYDISQRAPNAKIYILGYPRFFPLNPPMNCPTGVGPYQFAHSDMVWINEEAKKLDNAIATGAAISGATYVPTYDAMAGHTLCDKKPWINRAVLGLVLNHRAYSYHPTVYGQQALAQLLENALS